MSSYFGLLRSCKGDAVRKIIKLYEFTCLAACQTVALASDPSALSSELTLSDGSSLKLLGEYDIGSSLKDRYQIDSGSKYDFLNSGDTATTRKAWIGVAGEFGEVRAGLQDSLDTIAIRGADQHKVDGAYDLIMRGDDSVKRSITYMQKSGSVGLAAQYGTGTADQDDQSMGVLLNTQQGPYEAAIAYQTTPAETPLPFT